MTSSTVSSGQFASGLTLQSGDSLTVLSGGSATQIHVDSGALLQNQGGTVSNDIISGGLEQGDGIANSEILLAGGFMLLSAGGVASNTLIGAGGSQSLAGAASVSATVLSGGEQFISSGAVAVATTLSGGAQEVFFGGSASVTIVDQGGVQNLEGGVALGTVVNAGGTLSLGALSTASGAIINSGGFLSGGGIGGLAVNLTVNNGGAAYFSGFAGAASAVVNSGGNLFVNDRGSVGDDIIYNGGTQTDGALYGLGDAFGTTLSGGTEVVFGASMSTTIDSGGTQQVGSPDPDIGRFGQAIGAVVNSGGTQVIYSFASNTLVQSGGVVDVSSGLIISASVLSGGIISNAGTASTTQISGGGEQIIDQYAVASATFIASGGLEIVDQGGSSTHATIASGGVQQVMGATGPDGSSADYGVATDTVVDSGGTLRLEGAGSYDNPLDVIPSAQLLAGGTIDVTTFTYSATETATLNSATDMLSIDGGSFGLQVQLSGDYTNDVFSLAADALGGTDITDDGTPCFCRGTHILTDRGEVPVEHLRIGDHLITHAGQARPLRWIGRRAYTGPAAAASPDALPILFRAGSLGNGLPRRDLRVSPHHALYLDGVLIQADSLINTTTITQLQKVDHVQYFHLELETHDIILAEGAPAETYLEEHNRAMFHNASDYAARYPTAAAKPPRSCAPRIDHGPILHAIRRRLAAPQAATPPLRGFVEHIDRGRIAGWAQSGQSGAVRLRLAANGITLAAFHANRPRADVVAAIGGDLCCGFDHIIDGGLPIPSQTIAVIRVADGAVLARL